MNKVKRQNYEISTDPNIREKQSKLIYLVIRCLIIVENEENKLRKSYRAKYKRKIVQINYFQYQIP